MRQQYESEWIAEVEARCEAASKALEELGGSLDAPSVSMSLYNTLCYGARCMANELKALVSNANHDIPRLLSLVKQQNRVIEAIEAGDHCSVCKYEELDVSEYPCDHCNHGNAMAVRIGGQGA